MRTGAGFDDSSGAPPWEAPASSPVEPHSPWQSPVPYLFGGLAALLCLISLALLILACSYWKLSSYLDSPPDDRAAAALQQHDREKPSDDPAAKETATKEEQFLVIMAGDSAPTFIAVPIAAASAAPNSNKTGVDAKPGKGGKRAGLSRVTSPGTSEGNQTLSNRDQ
ncbi:protein GLUTAMINE DUMPER 4-like [Canna indica]|uniref:Protein GLUTAMINE DUMPER 4-like n=1 Tax=Canna indica TaxID=4628 RepID=A0AAQ3L2L7_9LILI|nr:protein GLUTAMINE DUMPER 4-like [Canna indica]